MFLCTHQWNSNTGPDVNIGSVTSSGINSLKKKQTHMSAWIKEGVKVNFNLSSFISEA